MKRFLRLLLILPFFLPACKKEDKPSVPEIIIIRPEIITFTPEKGSYNNTISIKGNHFDSSEVNTSVTFNGVVATVVSVKDTLIKVIVPQNATTGKITVTISGRADTSNAEFIILSGKWTRKGELPLAIKVRYGSTGFSIGNKGYIYGGQGNGTQKEFWEYDPVLNSWTEKPNPGMYLMYGLSMVINNKAYVGIGYNFSAPPPTAFVTQFWEYDPASNTWTRKADFPGTPRYWGTAFGVGNKGYAGLGTTVGQVSVNEWWEYDPSTNIWTRKTDIPEPTSIGVLWASGFVMNDRIFLGARITQYNSNWWEYNPATDVWIKKSVYPGGNYRTGPSGFTIGNKGYVTGGSDECWEYDAISETWKQRAFFDFRYLGVAFSIGEKGYYVLGDNSSTQQFIWEFDPGQ